MTIDAWQLHPQLAADTHHMLQLPSAHLLLHRNAHLHWLMLVPESHALDLLDLDGLTRDQLMADAAQIGRFLKEQLGYPRVNVGALGLVVPQLHLHVIGRRESDPCWPAPVWGKLTDDRAYSAEQLAELRSAVRSLFP